MIEEIAIDLIGEAGIALHRRAKTLGWLGGLGRGAGRGIVPQAVMTQNLFDDVGLCLDEGDDLHPAAALGTQQRIGLVDALDEDGPAAAVEFRREKKRNIGLIRS